MNPHIVWSTLVWLTILLQCFCGKFTNSQTHSFGLSFYITWGWFFLSSLPIFFYLMKCKGRSIEAPKIDWIAFVATLLYGMVFFCTLWGEPFSAMFQQEFLPLSLYWLIPAQAIVIAIIASAKRFGVKS